MKEGNKRTLLILAILVFVLLFDTFIFSFLNKFTMLIFMSVMTILAYYFLGYRKAKSRYDRDIILNIVIFSGGYYVFVYLVGFFIGFSRNIYSIDILSLVYNIFPIIISIIVCELLRYIINSKIKNNRLLLALSVISFAFLMTSLTIKSVDFNEYFKVLNVFGLYILPSLSVSFLLTYLTYKTDYKTSITYRLIMEIPKYIIPIIPNFGGYLDSVLSFITPMLMFMIIYYTFDKFKVKKIESKKSKRKHKLIYIIITIMLGIIIILNSGLFKYKSLVIATGSMTPNINKGDVVVVKKLNDEDKLLLTKGDVIAFSVGNRIIVHRIVEKYSEEGRAYFVTKGDNNKEKDDFILETHDIVGIKKINIRYIGYPTIMIYEKIKGV